MTRLVKKGDIVRILNRRWALPKNLITEVLDVYSRWDKEARAKVVWIIVKNTKGRELSCPVQDVALTACKGMRFQYKMNGPFVDA